MDLDRYRKRVRDLHGCAKLIRDLTQMPDRATEKDFREAADLMTGAANAIDDLLKAQPSGCICRRVEHDNYSYLDYAEGCLHHREMLLAEQHLKKEYARLESALKDEARMRIVLAALSGTAVPLDPRDITSAAVGDLVKRALAVADETLRQIIEEPEA